jgi:hypothetical protein
MIDVRLTDRAISISILSEIMTSGFFSLLDDIDRENGGSVYR